MLYHVTIRVFDVGCVELLGVKIYTWQVTYSKSPLSVVLTQFNLATHLYGSRDVGAQMRSHGLQQAVPASVRFLQLSSSSTRLGIAFGGGFVVI